MEIKRVREPGSDLVLLLHEGHVVYYFFKRLADILVAGGLLLFFLPLMAVISILIYVYSPGPIFFKQERVGAKRVFRGNAYQWERENFMLFKFRTMKVNGNEAVHKAYVQALIQNDHQKIEEIQGGEFPGEKTYKRPTYNSAG